MASKSPAKPEKKSPAKKAAPAKKAPASTPAPKVVTPRPKAKERTK